MEYEIRKDDVAFYLEQCQLVAKDVDKINILELGCGTGRVSIPLAKAGFNVTGIDLSGDMLNLARKKAGIEGVDIKFTEADFIEFKLNKKFDVVLMPYNAFQHIHADGDISRFFDNLKQHLNPGAKFVMEIMNPLDEDLSRGPDDFVPFDAFYVADCQDGRLHRTTQSDPKKKLLVIEDTVNYDVVNKVAHYRLYYSLDGEDLVTKTIDLRMFTSTELFDILNLNGFNVLKSYGDVQKRPLKNDSQSIVTINDVKDYA